MTDLMNESDLQELAERGAAELDGASAMDVLRWTDENFRRHLRGGVQHAGRGARRSRRQLSCPGVDVLFLDTGYHFVETVGTRDAVEAVYDINVLNITPENSVAKQDELFGRGPVRPARPTNARPGCAR